LAIASVGEPVIRAALRELFAAGAEAIVQVGADLVMTRLADEAERWLGKPVIAITPPMLWCALRAHGIADQMQGVGSLLGEHWANPRAGAARIALRHRGGYSAAASNGGCTAARSARAIGCGHQRSSHSENRPLSCGMTRSAKSLVL
jgi:hypothetical protein